jgi:predicted O-methyltransferase YrrM
MVLHAYRDAALQRIRTVIHRLVQDRVVVADSDGTTHSIFPVTISAEEGQVVRSWVVQEHATRTIEIGLGYALSALHICEGLVANGSADAHHLVIDPFQSRRFANVGLQVLHEAGLTPIIEHAVELSHVALPRLLSASQQFDLAFVDGNHRFDGVFIDLYYLGMLVRKGGIIILDDYDLPGIQRAVGFFVANLNWTIESSTAEWVVLRTPTIDDKRPFTYFVDF